MLEELDIIIGCGFVFWFQFYGNDDFIVWFVGEMVVEGYFFDGNRYDWCMSDFFMKYGWNYVV